jgi:hypothetical protein
MTVTATYSGEELNVTFVAQTERSDYGVETAPSGTRSTPTASRYCTSTSSALMWTRAFCRKNCSDAIYALSNEVEFE